MGITERTGEVTLLGTAVTLMGPRLAIGEKVPDAVLVKQDLTEVRVADYFGKHLLISAVPSLDTPVCDLQTSRFNQEAASLEGVALLTVSMDLPFAQARWCGAKGADQIEVLSDYREAAFGLSYGVLIKEHRLLARAVFVIDEAANLKYMEIVPEVSDHPDYEAALAAVKK